MRFGLLLLAGTVSASGAWGWGQTGHRVAGMIAAEYLSPEAEAAVSEILGSESLARASTWPDFMRSDPSEFWQQTANPWHYVTVPPGKTYEEVGAPPEGDAFNALQQFGETLRDREADNEQRTLALRFAVHIIADLHQPLHVGNGSDRGGNDFEVNYFGQATNLHRIWDSQMIDRMQLSYTELAAWLLAELDSETFLEWNQPDPLVWIEESAALRDRIYPDKRDLSWDYGFQWRSEIEKCLTQAGVRTAAWLNRLFSPDTD